MAEPNEQEGQQEEPKDLVPLTEEQKQKEQEIERWYYRMDRYPVPLPDKVRYMAARMAVAYGLDPFLGEMVFIEQWKNKKLVGYTPYVGIGGLRRAARRTGEYGGRKLRPCTEEERKALQIDEEDVHAWYCEVWRKGIDKPFDGFGVFPISDWDKKSTAPHWRMARKRAEHAALRAAFDLELQLMEANGLVVEEKPVEAEVTELPEEEVLGSFAPPQEEEPPPPTSEQAIAEAAEVLEEFLPEDKQPEQPTEELDLKEAITTGHAEGLWAYAEAKGIATGIVKTVLEETGGEVDETLARLKEKYGEVDDA